MVERACLYAYEVQAAPEVEPRGVSVVFHPEPLAAGERLTLGFPPDDATWEVIRVEPTGKEGQPVDLPLSGPPGFPKQPNAIWDGRVTLRPVA